MTQEADDIVIDNQGFANFRQDLNNVLKDITTLHSGDTAPTSTFANQWWYETDTDKLYIRNESDDAWIEILTLDQANDHLATLGASITLDGTGNVSIDSGDFTVDTSTLHVDSTNNRVGVGTSSPTRPLSLTDLTGDGTGGFVVSSYLPTIEMDDISAGGTSFILQHDTTSTIFKHDSTERMRINSSGDLLVGTTSTINNGNFQVLQTTNSHFAGYFRNDATTNSYGVGVDSQDGNNMYFYFNGTYKGRIGTSASGTEYTSASDYRLKENAVDITDGITRVKQLDPKRFNFIGDSKTVDGFMAHEAQAVVPEAVTGTKDAMRDEEYEVTPAVLDEDGNVLTEAVVGTRSVPDYQGIDQSKLVPLLTAALQEAITKIETLETKVAALEAE